MQIAVAHSRGFDFDEHFAWAGAVELRRFDRQRLALFPQNGGCYSHWMPVF
jgi:hypothetical protein